jgi:predicted  nucleic acid-binding Zn-ribbon protein
LVKELDEEIYSGKSNSKELHYLIYEKDKNKEEIQDLEVKMLNLLENSERDKEYLMRLKQQKSEMNQKYNEIKNNINSKKAKLLQKKKSLEEKREEIILELPSRLIEKYEDKKERLNYKFVCQIDESGMCTGCHVKLPSRVIKNLYNSEVQRCDECGRYLIHISD